MSGKRIAVKRLERLMVRMLCALNVSPADAKAIAWVYSAMTLRGMGHHDATWFPNLLQNLKDGALKARPSIATEVDRGAMAVMDGDNAPGPLAAYRMTETAIEKARQYGVGLACIRNSNHFVGAAPYALLAAKHKMLGLVASNTSLCMGTGASSDRAIGNDPWGFAVDGGAGYPLLLDICNAYASYGKLAEYAASGDPIPTTWGMDSQGRPTASAERVIKGGVPLPIGGHKGFSIALLVEILTGVLSGGAILDEIALGGGGSSQVALVLDISHFMPAKRFTARTRDMVDYLKAHPLLDPNQPTMMPGERSHGAAREIRKKGVLLDKATIAKFNGWFESLGIRARF
jgi:ureidoglycolate dehydrogenase (NAD+)